MQLCPDHQKNGYSHWVGLIVHKGAPVRATLLQCNLQGSTVSPNPSLQLSLSTAQHVGADTQAPSLLLLSWYTVGISAGPNSEACAALHQPYSVCSPSHASFLGTACTYLPCANVLALRAVLKAYSAL